jgi:hypothetical protein
MYGGSATLIGVNLRVTECDERHDSEYIEALARERGGTCIGFETEMV